MNLNHFLRRLLSCLLATSIVAPSGFGASHSLSLITSAHAEAIYRRIINAHWVPDTGLFLSFPDSMDRKLSQQASLYEQGAVGLLALRLGDTERARQILTFLKDTWVAAPNQPERKGMRGLSNFYNGYFGASGIENVVHLGPNAWIGLFAARLANTLHDQDALRWALDISYWMMNSLPHNTDGAVAMGIHDDPNGAPWAHIFSTENNISYDAMLNEILRSPQLESAQRASIARERDNVENWLFTHAFDPKTYSFYRGFNPQGADPLKALDTTTWLLSAVGPQKLSDHGIDPNRLMAEAEKLFAVTVQGKKGVDASDQTEADFIYLHLRNTKGQPARPEADHHRLIWYEGLGQYILAWATMADFNQQNHQPGWAAHDLEKAKELADGFDEASLTHISGQAAYPYASKGRFFRDGWETQIDSPHGPAASLIAATWRSFAGLGWDPLSGTQLASVNTITVSVPKEEPTLVSRPPVLYGTSEQMVVNAWAAIKKSQWETAIEQAKATIQEWSPWATKLQERKAREVGHLMSFDGNARTSQTIFSYWALNDVGAAYFVLGKAYDAQGDYVNACRSFQQVINRYPLAQVWDPSGWFWSPLEAIQSDYVQRDPGHYSSINPEAMAKQQ